MDMPWKTLTGAEPGQEYLFLLSYLPLRTYGKIPALLRYMFQIRGQLSKTPGVVGYSLRAKILQKSFWTLSVWESEGVLIDFVTKAPHREAMKKISPYMAATKFTRWKARGSAIPPDWTDAIRRESKEN